MMTTMVDRIRGMGIMVVIVGMMGRMRRMRRGKLICWRDGNC